MVAEGEDSSRTSSSSHRHSRTRIKLLILVAERLLSSHLMRTRQLLLERVVVMTEVGTKGKSTTASGIIALILEAATAMQRETLTVMVKNLWRYHRMNAIRIAKT